VWPRLRESFGFGAFGTSDRDSVGAENHEGKHAKACGERPWGRSAPGSAHPYEIGQCIWPIAPSYLFSALNN
jgi:hypothetical protein